MSLLHRGTETVAVYPEETTTDADGNTVTRPSSVGVVLRAVVQPVGTSTDGQDGRFETLASTAFGWSDTPVSSVLSRRSNGTASGGRSTENPGFTTALAVPLALTT